MIKEIKLFLKKNGFHHSWGYWIDDNNPQNRVVIHSTKNTVYIKCTKTGTLFSDGNKFVVNKRGELKLLFEYVKSFFS